MKFEKDLKILEVLARKRKPEETLEEVRL